MHPTLHIIGTGPGDPQLLTIKAMNILNKCEAIVAPKGSQDGHSTALAIVSQIVPVDEKEVYELYFPMKKIKTG